MIGKYLGGYLAARTGDRNAFILIQLLTIVGFFLMILLPATPLLVVLPLIGMVVQGSSTVSYGAIASFTAAERQARGFALIYSVGSAAVAIGPFLFGLMDYRLNPAVQFRSGSDRVRLVSQRDRDCWAY